MTRFATLPLMASLLVLPLTVAAQTAGPSTAEREHTAWIDHVLRSTAALKPGMTRSDLLKVFTTEGGLSSRTWRTYVYRGCPYIKVDVEFEAVGDRDPSREDPRDKITKISRPYLNYSVMD